MTTITKEYTPSLSEIAAKCDAIRASWTPAEREARRDAGIIRRATLAALLTPVAAECELQVA